MSDLAEALPRKFPSLGDDIKEVFRAYKNRLDALAVLETLSPNIRQRVEVLIDYQAQHNDLEAKFFEEKAALEAKYQNLYEHLYSKRYDIVTGVVEVEGVKSEAAADNKEDKATEEKGVPVFWLCAMKMNKILREISERDEEALKFLKDIKWHRIDDHKGFKLEFFFGLNPFFKNSVLTKTYHMINDNELFQAIGTEIEWLPGKSLTQKVLKEEPENGSKNAKPITETESCESFFNFFNPPQVPEEEDDIKKETAEMFDNQMKHDYDIGSTIRDEIIPHAVSWFTGVGDESEDDDMEDGDYEDDEGW